MPEFSPDGYVSTQRAIATAAERWFAEQVQKLQTASESQAERKPEGHIEQAVRAFSGPTFLEEFEQLANQTVSRMRSILHKGELTAYYFDSQGRHSVLGNFWATAEADGVLESGRYWPFGRPSRVYERRPSCCPLFLREAELQKLLTDQTAKTRRLPRSKIPEIVAALAELGGNRQAQYRALCEFPQFREFKITRADFREAARELPREAGRKSRQEPRRK